MWLACCFANHPPLDNDAAHLSSWLFCVPFNWDRLFTFIRVSLRLRLFVFICVCVRLCLQAVPAFAGCCFSTTFKLTRLSCVSLRFGMVDATLLMFHYRVITINRPADSVLTKRVLTLQLITCLSVLFCRRYAIRSCALSQGNYLWGIREISKAKWLIWCLLGQPSNKVLQPCFI